MLILAVLEQILWIGSAPSCSAAFCSSGKVAPCHGSFDDVPVVVALGPVAHAPVELLDADDASSSQVLVSTAGGACVGSCSSQSLHGY